jgi:hypothetical protein
MRLQQQRVALEGAGPQAAWLLLLAPAALLVCGAALDYSSAFDVRQFSFPPQHCGAGAGAMTGMGAGAGGGGCNLSYTVNNTFGIIPLNYIQVATSFTAAAPPPPPPREREREKHGHAPASGGANGSSADSGKIADLTVLDVFGSQEAGAGAGAVPCGGTGLVTDFHVFPPSQGSTAPGSGSGSGSAPYSFCAGVRGFRPGAVGTLEGLALDSPSAALDGLVQAVQTTVRFPAFSPAFAARRGLATVQFVLISPLYVAARTVLQLLCVALTSVVTVAYFRAVRVSESCRVPEQVG